MSHLSIRTLPEELEKAITNDAKKYNTTKTAVVLDALKEFFLKDHTKSKIKRNLRGFFCDKMTKQEFKEFQKYTSDFSLIDERMWK